MRLRLVWISRVCLSSNCTSLLPSFRTISNCEKLTSQREPGLGDIRNLLEPSSLLGGPRASIRPSRPSLMVVFVLVKESAEQLVRDLAAQLAPIVHGMPIVKTGIDACVLDLGDQIIGVVEGVGGVGDEAVHHEVHLMSAEEPRENVRDCSGGASVCCRILRMRRRCRQWSPIGIA